MDHTDEQTNTPKKLRAGRFPDWLEGDWDALEPVEESSGHRWGGIVQGPSREGTRDVSTEWRLSPR